jgi:hypothetical protein
VLERRIRVLLDEQDGRALPVNLLDGFEDRVHEERRETE